MTCHSVRMNKVLTSAAAVLVRNVCHEVVLWAITCYIMKASIAVMNA